MRDIEDYRSRELKGNKSKENKETRDNYREERKNSKE
jgi:hypothetical protein